MEIRSVLYIEGYLFACLFVFPMVRHSAGVIPVAYNIPLETNFPGKIC